MPWAFGGLWRGANLPSSSILSIMSSVEARCTSTDHEKIPGFPGVLKLVQYLCRVSWKDSFSSFDFRQFGTPVPCDAYAMSGLVVQKSIAQCWLEQAIIGLNDTGIKRGQKGQDPLLAAWAAGARRPADAKNPRHRLERILLNRRNIVLKVLFLSCKAASENSNGKRQTKPGQKHWLANLQAVI